MPQPQTEVFIYLEGKQIDRKLLSQGEYLIGADLAAQIRFPSEQLAERHALLTIRPDEWVIQDLESPSGTFLNGKRVQGSAVVSPSQKIEIAGGAILLERFSEDGATLSDATLSLAPRPEGDSAIPEALRVRGDRKYRIGGIVARGGMGTILDAHESATQRHVAMKIMAEKTACSDISRFVQEAQITANLEHPNIVPVHELSLNEQDQPFYTMKLVHGISLKKVLEMLSLNDPGTLGAYSLSVLLTIFQKVCDGVAFAHSKGILHRDLKPDNIMLGEYGEALVMDWGLAKKMGEPATVDAERRPAGPPILMPREGNDEGSLSAGSTLVGTVMGTPQFMSPEQAWGETDRIDGRTDIYSLGAILYQLLVLKPPFAPSKNPEETLNAVRKGRVIPLATAAGSKPLPHLPGGHVPDSLAAVAIKALALEPDDRYAHVTDLQQEIAAYQNGFATRAEGASAWRLLSLFIRRHRNLSIAAAVLLLSAVIFTVNIAHQKHITSVQRNVAEDHLYLSHVLQAWGAIQGSDPENAYDLLAQHRDEGSKRELRGWEWYYLLGQLNQDRLRVANAHAGGAFALAATNDGSQLASGGNDGDIAVWKTAGLGPVRRIHAHKGAVLSLAWDSSGKRIASGGEDGVVCIWDAGTGEKLASVPAPSRRPVRALAWDPSDPLAPSLAFGGPGFDVMLWDPLVSGTQSGADSLFASTNGITCLDWSADGRRIAFAELDSPKGLLILDVVSRQPLISSNGMAAGGSDISAVAIDPGGQYVATGTKHSIVSIFEIETGREIFNRPIHQGIVNAVAWSPDGKQLASASQDCTIRLTVRPSPGAPAKEQQGPAVFASYVKSFNAIAWTRLPGAVGDSTTAIFSAATDGAIRASSFKREAGPHPLDGWIAAAHWSPDGRWIAAADFQWVVHIIDPASGLEFPLWPAKAGLNDVKWSPTGDRVATAARFAGQVEIMDSASGKTLAQFSLPGGDRIAWSASGEFLAASSREAASSGAPPGVHIWNSASGKEIRSIPQSASSLLWSRDNRNLVVGQTDGSIKVWDVLAETSPRVLRPAPPPLVGSLPSEVDPPRMVTGLAYSPDEKRVAFVTEDGMAAVLDSGDGKVVRKFAESLTSFCCVTWSPDGRRIATTGKDGFLRLYSPEDGGQMLQIQHGSTQDEKDVEGLDWSRDGWRILTGGHDGVVRVWNGERGRQVDAVEAPSAASPLFRDPSESPKMEKTFAHLGWVDRSREAYKAALPRAAGEGAAAEAWFSNALSSPDPIEVYFDPALRANRRIFSLLNAMTGAWVRNYHMDAFVESDWERIEMAVKDYGDLSALPEAAGRLPLAQRYFSRAKWMVTWFPAKAAAFEDATAWRGLAAVSGAITVREQSRLSFPYHGHGPRSLGIDSELTAHGPEAANCGMIATTVINLPAGKWRFQVEGDGGARVVVNGSVLIDSPPASAPGVHFRDYEQAERNMISIIVEQSVAEPSSGFEFLLFPVPGK